MRRLIGYAVLFSLLLGLQGCETIVNSTHELIDSLPKAKKKIDYTELNLQPNWVRATGYAPISLQPGQTQQHKVILAMRASKLRAYQELAAIVHGQYLFGTTTVSDMVMQDDQFKTAVAGIIRGARVVKTFPVQEDTYATILEVDTNQIQRAWVSEESSEPVDEGSDDEDLFAPDAG